MFPSKEKSLFNPQIYIAWHSTKTYTYYTCTQKPYSSILLLFTFAMEVSFYLFLFYIHCQSRCKVFFIISMQGFKNFNLFRIWPQQLPFFILGHLSPCFTEKHENIKSFGCVLYTMFKTWWCSSDHYTEKNRF